MKPIWSPVNQPELVVKDRKTYFVRDVQRLVVGGEPNVRLLSAVWSDEGVNFGDVDVVQLLDGLLDLALVRLQLCQQVYAYN
jgi:hypothetical protein